MTYEETDLVTDKRLALAKYGTIIRVRPGRPCGTFSLHV